MSEKGEYSDSPCFPAAENVVRESEAKHRTLVETANAVILLTDLNGKQLPAVAQRYAPKPGR